MAEDPRSDELAVVVSDDGALVLGPAAELERLSDSTDSSPITPQLLQRAGQALSGLEQYQKESGRWLKLDDESAAYLKRLGLKPGDIRAGVIRVKDTPRGAKAANGGALLKHVKFDKAGLLTPAAPMVLASMMQQVAVEKQMAQMQTYLERIDAKLDAVLRFQQDTLAGELDGVAETLAEAALVLEGTEKVTDTQWASVQHLNADLAKLQGRVLRHLTAVAERMAQSKTSPGKVKETFQKTNSEARFWLYELARTVQLQNQMYILQLNRVTAVEGDVSEDYVAAVDRAREKRAARLLESLSGIAGIAHELGSFSTFRKAIDWNSPRAVQEVNRFFAQLRDFANAANLAVEGTEDLEPVRHLDAFRELTATGTAREAAGVAQQRATEAGETVANRARQAWGTTRGAIESATKGADNSPDKTEND